MRKLLLPLLTLVLASCTGPSARIRLFANGELDKKAPSNTINILPGYSHLEHEFDAPGKEINITVSNEKKDATAPGQGFYVWNLKKDTLVGSRQLLGATGQYQVKISTEMLRHKIDSLKQLVSGQNISSSKQNFFLPPGTFQKLTESTDVLVVGPYNSLPSQLDEKQYSLKTEVYRFYNTQTIREQIARLELMLGKP